MNCIYPKKPCPYRRLLDTVCAWSCEYDEPSAGCNVADAGWGCHLTCIYEAIDPKTDCPHKNELMRKIREKVTS